MRKWDFSIDISSYEFTWLPRWTAWPDAITQYGWKHYDIWWLWVTVGFSIEARKGE